MAEHQAPHVGEGQKVPGASQAERVQRRVLLGAVFLLLLVAIAVVVATLYMVRNPGQTETWRDIMIIFLAFEFLVIGLALIVLILQLARLTALLQEEISPILQSTSETVNTLRGTTAFLSDNLVRPVIRAGSSMAALRRAVEWIRAGRSKS